MERRILAFGVVFAVAAASSALGEERHMMPPRVPADKLTEARALTNPLPDSPEVVAQGRSLYTGKGTCVNCHGQSGGGDGPVAGSLDPAPRNFQHHGFWRHRSEGELFWVIKHGSPGTAMIGFGDQLTDNEIWSTIRYERTFAGSHGSGMMGHRQGMGPGGGMGRRGMRGCADEGCGDR